LLALVKVVAILAALVWFSRRRIDFGLVMIGAAVACAVLFAVPPLKAIETMLRSPFVPTNLTSILVVGMVGVLKALMIDAGMMARVVNSLTVLVRDARAVVAVLPAFIGLLPSAGGAVMSCSMVEEASKGMGLSPEQKAAANYWYRHVIEYFIPVYPAFILASQLSATPIRTLMMLTTPAAAVHAAVGALMIFGGRRRPIQGAQPQPYPVSEPGPVSPMPSAAQRRAALRGVVINMAPIIATVLLVVVAEWHIGVALGVVIGAMLLFRWPGWARLFELARESFLSRPALMLVGILAFKEMLIQSGAVASITDYLATVGAPPLVMAMALPFTVAAVTGLTTAAVGISFPMLAGVFLTSGGSSALAAVAYVSAVAGLMTTPTHLCMVLTVDYFTADVGRLIRLLAPAVAAVLASGPLVYLLSLL
jgi:integral membrane protein (TIGR00529 family)